MLTSIDDRLNVSVLESRRVLWVQGYHKLTSKTMWPSMIRSSDLHFLPGLYETWRPSSLTFSCRQVTFTPHTWQHCWLLLEIKNMFDELPIYKKTCTAKQLGL